MCMRVVELYVKVKSSFECVMDLTAGSDAVDCPILRVNMVCDGLSAENVQTYDAVFYKTAVYKTAGRSECSITEIAQVLKNHGASVLILSGEDFSMNQLERLRECCDNLSLPLIEIQSGWHMPAVMHRFYEELLLYDEPVHSVAGSLLGIIRQPETFESYSTILGTYGFYKNSDYCVAVLLFVGNQNTDHSDTGLIKIARFIETGVSSSASAVSLLCIGNRIAAVFADTEVERAEELLTAGLKAIPAELSEIYMVYMGISEKSKGLSSISPLFKYAEKAAMMQLCNGCDRCFARYSDDRLSKFIINLSDRNAVDDFVNETLGALLEYDALYNTDYVNLLRAYFRNNCSLKNTARELFVHRNSVNYALRKIESITKVSLSDINIKVELLLALRLYEISAAEKRLECRFDK